jgi:hypothetical protein
MGITVQEELHLLLTHALSFVEIDTSLIVRTVKMEMLFLEMVAVQLVSRNKDGKPLAS